MGTRWSGTDAPRGDDYDARWTRLAASGRSVHGEADLVDALLRASGGRRVLDAGCGTGRVAIELARRGYDVVGADLDPGMLGTARAKAPGLSWVEVDLARIDGAPELADAWFDLVVMAGNVMIFLEPGTELAVLTGVARHLVDGGLLVAGFQLGTSRHPLDEYDRVAEAAGLELAARWATWEQAPFRGGDYAVSVHRARAARTVSD